MQRHSEAVSCTGWQPRYFDTLARYALSQVRIALPRHPLHRPLVAESVEAVVCRAAGKHDAVGEPP
jgi:hypothetical protein